MTPDCHSVEYEMTDGLAAKYARAMLADRWFVAPFARAFGPLVYILALVLFAPVLPTLALRLPAGVLLVVLAGLGLLVWALFWLVLYRQAREVVLLPFLGQPRRTLRVIFAADGVTLNLAGGDVGKKWAEIDAIRVYRTLWLFRVRPGGYFAVPDALVSPELESLIRGKAGEFDIDVRG
jgi:hypothetical protein